MSDFYAATGQPYVYPHERQNIDVWGWPTNQVHTPPTPHATYQPALQHQAPARVKRPRAEWDTECAHNWWLLKIRFPLGHMKSYELRPEKPAFYMWEIAEIEAAMAAFTWVGFNSLNYDEPMLKLALRGVGVHVLKEANDAIIPGAGGQGLRRWEFAKAYPLADYRLKDFDHIDIMEVVPGVRISLKTYMTRYHAKTIQDLPFDPDAWLDEETIRISDEYCGNDLLGTHELSNIIHKRMSLRDTLTDKLQYESDMQFGYGFQRIDLRSKSDAQMSEAIIKAKLGYRPEVPYIPTGYTFKLKVAPWLEFVTPQMQRVLAICKMVDFFFSRKEDGEPVAFPDGSKIKVGVNLPKPIASMVVEIGTSKYKFGIGGLHSMEKAQSIIAGPNRKLRDSDVGSFYPKTAILMRLFPAHVLPIYEEIFNQRMDSKPKVADLQAQIKKLKEMMADPAHIAAKQYELEDLKTIVDGLKIVLNGAYGKLWSKYSFLLDPDSGIAITLNGQLSLLMLIERLEVGGVSVVSANTDGIVTLCPDELLWYRDSTMEWWQRATGYELEHTDYRSIHSRDVNSYVAVKPDGSVKRKGKYSESGVLSSMQGVHPDMDISKEAAIAYIVDKTPIETTVRQCRDLRKFILAKSVKGGGHWKGQYLGKTVRWYFSVNGCQINYISNGNKVGSSDGAMPVQVLPDEMPLDVDYAKYEEYARKLLRVTGVAV